MSIEPEEIIKRQNERIAKLRQALALIRCYANGKVLQTTDIKAVQEICAKALEEKG